MSSNSQDERHLLREILESTQELLGEARKNRVDVLELLGRAKAEFEAGDLTQLSYDIDQKLLGRAQQDIEISIRALASQHKHTLQKLNELEG